jgi:hypothetical protein
MAVEYSVNSLTITWFYSLIKIKIRFLQ